MAHLRPEIPEDQEFLYRLYASTRASEMSLVAWTAEQKEAFLRMQFAAQRAHYIRYYPTAVFQLVEVDGLPAGRLYTDRWEKEIRVMDIALLPEYCGRGIGTELMQEILAEGRQTGKMVTIHVELNNPARRLYERLGFALAEDKGVYLFMRWSPPK